MLTFQIAGGVALGLTGFAAILYGVALVHDLTIGWWLARKERQWQALVARGRSR